MCAGLNPISRIVDLFNGERSTVQDRWFLRGMQRVGEKYKHKHRLDLTPSIGKFSKKHCSGVWLQLAFTIHWPQQSLKWEHKNSVFRLSRGYHSAVVKLSDYYRVLCKRNECIQGVIQLAAVFLDVVMFRLTSMELTVKSTVPEHKNNMKESFHQSCSKKQYWLTETIF